MLPNPENIQIVTTLPLKPEAGERKGCNLNRFSPAIHPGKKSSSPKLCPTHVHKMALWGLPEAAENPKVSEYPPLRSSSSAHTFGTSQCEHQGLPGGSQGKRICLQYRRTGFDPWVGKIPWRRAWQLTPVFLLGKFHGQRCLRVIVHGVSKSQTLLKRFSTM